MSVDRRTRSDRIGRVIILGGMLLSQLALAQKVSEEAWQFRATVMATSRRSGDRHPSPAAAAALTSALTRSSAILSLRSSARSRRKRPLGRVHRLYVHRCRRDRNPARATWRSAASAFPPALARMHRSTFKDWRGRSRANSARSRRRKRASMPLPEPAAASTRKIWILHSALMSAHLSVRDAREPRRRASITGMASWASRAGSTLVRRARCSILYYLDAGAGESARHLASHRGYWISVWLGRCHRSVAVSGLRFQVRTGHRKSQTERCGDRCFRSLVTTS